MNLTNEQWQLIQPILPPPPPPASPPPPRRGRPRDDPRAILDAILWKIRTRSTWESLPDRYPPQKTCYTYYQQWCNAGLLDRIYNILNDHLREVGRLDILKLIQEHQRSFMKGDLANRLASSPELQGTWHLSTAMFVMNYFLDKALERMKENTSFARGLKASITHS